MTPGMKVAAAVAGGYLLGRRKKAKLAISLGAWLIGKKLALDPKKLLTGVTQELVSSPQLSGLRDQVREEVLTTGKTVATTLLTNQAERLTDSLHERADGLRGNVDEAREGVSKAVEAPKRAARAKSGSTRKAAAKPRTRNAAKRSGSTAKES
ncbi:hypothetical protein [Amycolatopsis sp. CA-230715]|uniref:hypothetical protein n=1 Tax=Amycolatopsis sp. CA-230715 TaxID=2745196 RepID=UPI001C02B8AC|nr:hypothetical protein [Amycolatopsis sp. CA-230715]QWF86033.1 hypothetical protein HUW46_09514 [Amycolatopsis sp. CA-230715]